MVYCLNVQLYHLCGKSRFVCAHIGQKRNIYPPSIFCLHFRLVPLPLFAQVDCVGCYREKFFWFLFFWFSLVISEVLIEIIFLNFTLVILILNFFIFSDFVIVLVWFWLSDYRLIISIINLIVLTRFDYAWLSSSTRLIFARYSLSVLRYVYSHQFWLVSALSILLFCLL